VDWIDLAQARDRYGTFVNMIMNLGFHEVLGRPLAASQEEFSSKELVMYCNK
jgi:hypothetical protein